MDETGEYTGVERTLRRRMGSHRDRTSSPRPRGCCRSAAGSGTSPAARSPGRPSSTGSSASTRTSPRATRPLSSASTRTTASASSSLIANAVRTGAPLEFEHRIVRPDGAVRTLHCRGEVVSRATAPRCACSGSARTSRSASASRTRSRSSGSSRSRVDAAPPRVEQALEVVLRRLCRYGGFALGQAWTMAATHTSSSAPPGPSDSPLDTVHRAQPGDDVRARGRPAGQALGRHGETVWVEDVKSERRLLRASFAREVGIAAAMAVPVPSGERIVAVLEFFATEPRARDEAVLDAGLAGRHAARPDARAQAGRAGAARAARSASACCSRASRTARS